MFRFLYEMMSGGQHDELPRRRRGPDIAFDREAGTFVAGPDPEPSPLAERWLGRGEIPEGAKVQAVDPVEGLSVADEARALLQRPRSRDDV